MGNILLVEEKLERGYAALIYVARQLFEVALGAEAERERKIYDGVGLSLGYLVGVRL